MKRRPKNRLQSLFRIPFDRVTNSVFVELKTHHRLKCAMLKNEQSSYLSNSDV